MAKLTANISARQLAGFQAETDKFNAEKTAEYARKTPPQVWTPVTVDQRFDERMAAVGDRHAEEFIKETRKATAEKLAKLTDAEFAAIKATVDQKVPDPVKEEAVAEVVK